MSEMSSEKQLRKKRRRRRKKRFLKFSFRFHFQNQHIYYALLLLWGVVLLTGGGLPFFSKALALIGMGALIAWKPPRLSEQPWILWGGAGSLLLTLAMLVVPRFGGVGPTFAALKENFQLEIPRTLSVQPQATTEILFIQVALIGTLLLVLNHPLSSTSRREVMRVLIVVLACFGLGILVGNAVHARWVFAEQAQVFSFIANRNQMANLMMIGVVLCFGTTWGSLEKKGNWALLGIFLLVILLLALFELRSRACLILAFLGILTWIALKSMRGRRAPYIKAGIPVTLLLFSLFLYFGDESRDRVLDQITAGTSLTADFRLLIYRDTLAMFLERPWTGFGYGNFEAVFPQFRDLTFQAQRVVHPESDLFWLLTEGGVIGLAFILLLVAGILKITFPRMQEERDSARLLGFLCLILFLFHSFVDVSGHRIVTLLLAIFLVGMGVRRRDREQARELPAFYPLVWRGVGVLVLLLGVTWWASPLASIPTKEEHYRVLFEDSLAQSLESNDFQKLESLSTAYVAAFPVSYQSHFNRARAQLLQRQTAAAAQQFRIARFLNPVSQRLTFWEGEVWLGINPQWSLDAWRETLNRPEDPNHDFRRQMANYYSKYPQIQEGLLQLSEVDGGLRLFLLRQLNGRQFNTELERDIAYDPTLSLYSPEARSFLLRRWARFGGGEPLFAFIRENPEVVEHPWELEAVGLANAGQTREAIRTIRGALGQPEIPVDSNLTDVLQLEREFRRNPRDLLRGAVLLKKQIEEKRWAQALQTALVMSRNPDAPSYVYFWAGEIYFMQDELENSWSFFEEYLDRR